VPQVEDLEYIWSLIEERNTASNELRIRESDEYQVAGQGVIFAVDNGENRLLLIPIMQNTRIQEDRRSSGVQITLRTLLDGNVRRSFLAIVCLKPHLNSLFSIIASEIIEQLQIDASSPDIKAHQILNRWRELLELAPSDVPSREVITGTFGELYVLHKLVKYNANALRFWDGANKARHDFLARSAALEVKTTLDRSQLHVKICGCDQLESLPSADLYLVLIRLEHTKTGGYSLSDLVEMIRGMGGDSIMLLTQLAKLGITYDVLTQLKEDRYLVRDEFVYQVDEIFPRITSASFIGGRLPERVIALTYQIDLSTRPPYPLSEDKVRTLLEKLASEASM